MEFDFLHNLDILVWSKDKTYCQLGGNKNSSMFVNEDNQIRQKMGREEREIPYIWNLLV